MAKEKDSSLSKDERKALRRAEKEKKSKRSDSDGVHKSKDPKKEKKSKSKKERVALAEKVANEVENGTVVVEGEKEAEGDKEVEQEKEVEREDEEMVLAAKNDAEDDEKMGQHREDKKASTIRPVGALVPFANPLADEKVAKKVFKGVKKGEFYHANSRCYHYYQPFLRPPNP
jgi:H/ACA ribonucleoprotein complex subunit 2